MTNGNGGGAGGQRLASLDALRGFDMLWIIGGDILVHLLARTTDWPILAIMSDQLQHVSWEGLHAYDLIFPLFMFLSGISLTLSLASHGNDPHQQDPHQQDREGQTRFLNKVVRRAAILVALGVIYNFGWSLDPERFRLASVLGQIGIAYLAAAIVVLKLRSWWGRGLVLVLVLSIVAFLQLWYPVPGVGAGTGAGVLTPEGIANGWLDRSYLPGRLYGGSYDPEGILSVFSSISVTLMGALAGAYLVSRRNGESAKTVAGLLAFGAVLVALGLTVAPYYPIIKNVWTVSFDITAAGISMLLFALFYWFIDVLNYRRWTFFFVVIGMNSIGIYMAARFFAYPVFKVAGEYSGHPLVAIAMVAGVIAAEWLVLRACYRRGLFLKV